MKEMLGNFADGQIELYRSVSDILVFLEPPCLSMLGYGRVGQDHSDYSAHTCGRLAHFVLHIPMFISNRAFLLDATHVRPHAVVKVSRGFPAPEPVRLSMQTRVWLICPQTPELLKTAECVFDREQTIALLLDCLR
jgi:hypothetical protein